MYSNRRLSGYRRNPNLIAAIEKVGLVASAGQGADLRIAEVPDDVDWGVAEYAGKEHVEEVHRRW